MSRFALFVLGALLLVLCLSVGSTDAAPANSLTRIQEVLNSLYGQRGAEAPRGKKYFQDSNWRNNEDQW